MRGLRIDCKEAVRTSIIPILLGNSSATHRLSAKIYLRTGIKPYICDEKKIFADYIDPTSRFFPIFSKSNDALLCEILDYISSNSDYLPMIVPCDDRYSRFISENRAFLEQRAIITSESDFFEHKTIRYITSVKGEL